MPPFPDAELAMLLEELGVPKLYSQRGIPLQREATLGELVPVSVTPDREVLLIGAAADAWRDMQVCAAEEGITLLPVSGFRSIARQAALIRTKLARGVTIDAILAVNTAPGFSEHHTGRALDIATPGSQSLEDQFAGTPAFAWLSRHGSRFGFSLSYPEDNPHGLIYEPWHWLWKA